MKYILPLFCFLVLIGCSDKAREPTQEEIKAAASENFMKINDEVKAVADECRGQGSVIVNPITAMKCASVCSFDPKKCEQLPTLQLTDFKKLACEKAVGQPGWVCDYQYNVTSDSDFVIKMFRNIYGTENRTQSRFFKTEDGHWVMAPIN